MKEDKTDVDADEDKPNWESISSNCFKKLATIDESSILFGVSGTTIVFFGLGEKEEDDNTTVDGGEGEPVVPTTIDCNGLFVLALEEDDDDTVPFDEEFGSNKRWATWVAFSTVLTNS